MTRITVGAEGGDAAGRKGERSVERDDWRKGVKFGIKAPSHSRPCADPVSAPPLPQIRALESRAEH